MIHDLKPYTAYKSSGVPWVGDIPEHWTTLRGKALFLESCLPVRDSDEIVTCFRDGQVTLRRNRRMSGFMIALKEGGYQGVRKGQLVIHAMDAFAGAVGVSDSNGKCTPEYIVCNPRRVGYAPEYFASVLRLAAQSKFIEVECQAVRERAPRLRYPTFGSMQLPIPASVEQLAIVRYLNYVDGRIRRYISAKKKLIALLNEQKQAIIHRAVTRGLDPNVQLKPSNVESLEEVPEHWEVKPFARCAIEMADYRGATPTKTDSGVFLVTARNVRKGWIDYEVSKEFVAEEEYSKIMRRGLPRLGDLILTMEAPLGNAALVDREDVALAQRVVRFRFASERLAPAFVLHSVLSPYFQSQLLRRATGSTALGIKAGKLPQLQLVYPSLAEQRSILQWIADECSPLSRAAEHASLEVDLLHEYRTRLIADVVTGKLDVREAAARLPDEADDPEPLDDADALTDSDAADSDAATEEAEG